MIDDTEHFITDIRLSAIATLLEQLFAVVLANLSEEESAYIKKEITHPDRTWALRPGDPPTSVDALESKTKLILQVIDRQVERIEERERALRQMVGN